MSKLVQLWLLGAALVVSGCLGVGTEEAPVVQSAGNINTVCGSKWELKRLRINGEAVPIDDTKRFTFLCSRDGNVMGKSGINTYRGALQITANGQLLWDTSSFASTKMAGPEDQVQQENSYLRALAGTRQSFTKAGGKRLILRDPSGNIYIEYVKVGP
ncbi:META domain-containing protein [Microbulbifer thermotolerans]|uniref:META domain-containing protein n=1 Tax=Microbulbifer thermotolerans TaxID=252514 RepID=A0A143HPT8_MICTH|nr:META domain-containing protein [Microbulbifer thermotolerans]AMX03698.1 META domain-containing protein [Microbulbifer thermotolerans]MCX2781073.1 META domain-containing protein [Microbulbifer thermotolerans]MCX2783646.1 META domain-containing protein [Microbulbifer thermotolerans]MCX2796243.1 META domain-containing protein [Microbulbifer thermotolerans]MCX2803211.1 META domain-containing protein [Microbulbifer thermotolerans]